MSRGSHLGLRHLDDGLMLTDDTAWAWFELPTVSYDFLSGGEREALLLGHALALAGLSGSECHLAIVPEAYEVAAWAAALDRSTSRPASGWKPYLDAIAGHVT
ncbi:MAG: ATPase, partial [Nitriliruptorales bacterium]|nr:ATPase [Nitriliruptorales bacterium]